MISRFMAYLDVKTEICHQRRPGLLYSYPVFSMPVIVEIKLPGETQLFGTEVRDYYCRDPLGREVNVVGDEKGGNENAQFPGRPQSSQSLL
jgi:hypothetical protein